MAEIEVPLEKVQEDIHEHAVHTRDRLMMRVALTSSFLAALAAVAALLAGYHSNESLLDQLHASDQWGYYQAKGIKAAVLGAKADLLRAVGRAPTEKDEEKLAEYRKEQDEIKAEAETLERDSRAHLGRHVILSRAVTMFQIAITVAAISALTRRRRFLALSFVFGGIGTVFLAQGLLF